MDKIKGRVKWFSQDKGYGFIQHEQGPDVFVHHTAIQGSGFKTLNEGEEVEFELVEEAKGPKAANVQRLNPTDGARRPGGAPPRRRDER